jgi:hypothetical protein
VHEEVFEALQQDERRWRARLEPDRLTRTVALVVVPAAVAVLVGLVYQDADRLLWPPPPLLALAPLGSYLVLRRITGSLVELTVYLLLASFVAVLAMWGMALLFGLAFVLEGCGPQGGCLPGW